MAREIHSTYVQLLLISNLNQRSPGISQWDRLLKTSKILSRVCTRDILWTHTTDLPEISNKLQKEHLIPPWKRDIIFRWNKITIRIVWWKIQELNIRLWKMLKKTTQGLILKVNFKGWLPAAFRRTLKSKPWQGPNLLRVSTTLYFN